MAKPKSKQLVPSKTTVTKQGRLGSAKFHTGHTVEEYVKVYLRLSHDGARWEIDPIIDDGFALDGLSWGPIPSESDCQCINKKECWAAHNHAAKIELPTAVELFQMLRDFYLGG